MKLFFFLPFLLFSVILCHAQAQKDTAQHITLDTMEVTASAGAIPYQPSYPKAWEIKNTRIALSFNFKERTANAREWLKLRPYFYPVDTLALDAKGMRIDSVMLKEKKGFTKLNYTYENNRLLIRFELAYHATDSIELYLKYTAMPYASSTGGSGAITDDRGLYFINADYSVPNKPAQIWTQGETESNSHWMITVDKPNTRFSTQIELTVPDSFVTLSNGALIGQAKGAGGMRTDIWRMPVPIQAYAVMFAIGKFSIIKDHWRNKEVSYYVEPEYAPSARLMFKNTLEMIEYFSQRTGVLFPWNKYSQVVVRDYVSGAMENTSASLFGEFMNQTLRELADRGSEDVVSHELFHQWFGDYVTCESWSNITLNESFANYGEQLWRTHKYGKASGDEIAYNDLQGYIGASQYNDPQLVRFNYDSREEVFDAISYNKGGAVLRYLNGIMGDEAFDKAMKTYLTKNALSSAEAHQWRLAIEEVTGQDWNWFFNEFYFHAGHPILKVTYNYDDTQKRLTVIVNQTQTDSTFTYRLPLKAALIYGRDITIFDWNITKKKDTFTYTFRGGQRPLFIPNYTHMLPGELKDGKKPPEWLAQFFYSDNYSKKRQALSAAGKLLSDSSSQALIDFALNDPLPSIRRSALAILAGAQSDKYHRKWTPKVTAMASMDSNRLVRAEAYSVLGEWKVAAAKQDMVHTAITDSSYLIAGNALEAIGRIDVDTAYILSRELLKTNPRSTLESAIWSIIGKKGADDDIALYEKRAPFVLGSKKFSFAFSLNNYLKNVKSEASFRRGIDIYTNMIVTESMKSRRAELGAFLFQVASEQKSKAKSDNKDEAATAQKRLEIVKAALEKVVAAEKDTETQKDFKKMFKENFE